MVNRRSDENSKIIDKVKKNIRFIESMRLTLFELANALTHRMKEEKRKNKSKDQFEMKSANGKSDERRWIVEMILAFSLRLKWFKFIDIFHFFSTRFRFLRSLSIGTSFSSNREDSLIVRTLNWMFAIIASDVNQIQSNQHKIRWEKNRARLYSKSFDFSYQRNAHLCQKPTLFICVHRKSIFPSHRNKF